MSRTKLPRGEKRQDFYPTPAWCANIGAHELMRHVRALKADPVTILDAGCGTGVLARAVACYVNTDVVGMDIDEKLLEQARGVPTIRGDFLTEEGLEGCFDGVIMNPPFSQALEFVQRALEIAPVVTCLARLGFAASKRRLAWHELNPSHMCVLSRRPIFVKGQSDNCDYAWFTWSRSITSPTWSVTGG